VANQQLEKYLKKLKEQVKIQKVQAHKGGNYCAIKDTV